MNGYIPIKQIDVRREICRCVPHIEKSGVHVRIWQRCYVEFVVQTCNRSSLQGAKNDLGEGLCVRYSFNHAFLTIISVDLAKALIHVSESYRHTHVERYVATTKKILDNTQPGDDRLFPSHCCARGWSNFNSCPLTEALSAFLYQVTDNNI